MRLKASLSLAAVLAVVSATAALSAGPDPGPALVVAPAVQELRPACHAPSASSTVCWTRPSRNALGDGSGRSSARARVVRERVSPGS